MNNRSNYNPNIHHRRSIRLKGYNYSKAGLYFITICVKDKLELFGEINQKLILNDSGKMIERWYSELENKYPDKRCHEMIVMPNHFHCILENLDGDGGVDVNGNVGMVGDVAMVAHVTVAHVGAPLRGRPLRGRPLRGRPLRGRPLRGRPLRGRPFPGYQNIPGTSINEPETPYGIHNIKHNATISDAIGWFKTMTTNEYIRGVKTLGWNPFNGKLWQRNFYEHIIRNEQSYQRISEYIINNPAKWIQDKFYK